MHETGRDDPLTDHDVPVDFICWDDLTEEKIAAIPLLAAQRAGQA